MTDALIVPAIWVAGALLLALIVAVVARRHRQREARSRLRQLSKLRSPTGRPFFPDTPEGRRREARILRGWDPDFDD
jgi:hypothetical protein